MSNKQISVLVADPQALVAEALGRSLSSFADISTLPDHPRSGLAVVDLAEFFHPEVLLLEYWMEGMLAPAVIRAVHQKNPDCRVIVMSWLHGRREVLNSLYAGAVGFLTKSTKLDQVAQAIRLAHSGHNPVFQEQLDELIGALTKRDEEALKTWQTIRQLSRRELQILVGLSRRTGLKEIAANLSITPKTARNYLDNMMRKMGTQTQIELLAMARDYGLIS